jgi:flagellar protein FlbD
MILLTRLNGREVVVNVEQVVFVESTPDTRLTLIGGERLMVREAVEEVVRRAEAFRRRSTPATSMQAPAEKEAASWTSQP